MVMFIYLASPYSPPTDLSKAQADGLREARYIKACRKAAELMEYGHQVFCPIAHSHPIEVIGMDEIHSGEFWLKQDFAILKHVDAMYVYQMKGWDTSKGIRAEIEFALAHNIPVFFLETSGKVVPYGTQDRLVA
jgi:nucleoside 2-deoxyribosyltransferase